MFKCVHKNHYRKGYINAERMTSLKPRCPPLRPRPISETPNDEFTYSNLAFTPFQSLCSAYVEGNYLPEYAIDRSQPNISEHSISAVN